MQPPGPSGKLSRGPGNETSGTRKVLLNTSCCIYTTSHDQTPKFVVVQSASKYYTIMRAHSEVIGLTLTGMAVTSVLLFMVLLGCNQIQLAYGQGMTLTVLCVATMRFMLLAMHDI